nr:hypothetical protein [Thermoleophilaceae bacterium]
DHGRYYELWRRLGDPPRQHIPFGTAWSAAAVPPCASLRALGGPLIAAERPAAVLADIAATRPLPAGWGRVAGKPQSLYARTGGSVFADIVLPRAGRYAGWLQGRTYREVELLVDGRPLGAHSEVNGPNQWIEFDSTDLSAGRHRVEVRRPRRSLAPGDALTDEFGPAVLVPAATPRLVRVRSGSDLCGRSLDWVERP